MSAHEQIPNTQTRCSLSPFVNKFRARRLWPNLLIALFIEARNFAKRSSKPTDANCSQDRLEATMPSPDSRNYRETEGRMNRYSGCSGIGTLRGRDKAIGSRGNLCGAKLGRYSLDSFTFSRSHHFSRY